MNLKHKSLKLYYFFWNPIYRGYCFIFRPKSFGVKLVVENENKILMVRISYAHKKWTFPGGGVKKGETFEKAVIRELKEECGIKTQNVIEMGEYASDSNFKRNIVKCFYLSVDSNYVNIDNFEVTDSGWYDPKKLPIPEDCSFAVPKIMKIYNEFKK